MKQMNQASHHRTTFNSLRAQRGAQPRRAEDASPVEVAYSLNAQELETLVEALPRVAESSALELLVSVGGCFSCGHSFKGSVTIIDVCEERKLAHCPQCHEPALIALNLLNELLSERRGVPTTLSAFCFSQSLELGAQRHFHRSAEWLAHAALSRRCVGAGRLLRKRRWSQRSA